jgi:glyoxylase-like metal-dependent hydrolase (beta-lactamase superfamily II)
MLDAAGRLKFPNASYYVGETEWQFWTATDVASRLPPQFRSVVAETQQNLRAIMQRMTLVKTGDDIVGGMRVVDTPGHTPGHFSLELEGGDGLIVTADAVTHPLISFKYPTWHNGFDLDSDVAVRTRKRLLARTSHDRSKLLVYHLPLPRRWVFGS